VPTHNKFGSRCGSWLSYQHHSWVSNQHHSCAVASLLQRQPRRRCRRCAMPSRGTGVLSNLRVAHDVEHREVQPARGGSVTGPGLYQRTRSIDCCMVPQRCQPGRSLTASCRIPCHCAILCHSSRTLQTSHTMAVKPSRFTILGVSVLSTTRRVSQLTRPSYLLCCNVVLSTNSLKNHRVFQQARQTPCRCALQRAPFPKLHKSTEAWARHVRVK
jgi:hypothetical protein